MPVKYDPYRPHVDHIIAKQHGGLNRSSNLAFTCAHCNSHKGPNIASVDPKTRRVVQLFDPRLDRWKDHFVWNGPLLVGRTAKARATIQLLKINLPRRVEVRASLMEEGVY